MQKEHKLGDWLAKTGSGYVDVWYGDYYCGNFKMSLEAILIHQLKRLEIEIPITDINRFVEDLWLELS